MFPDICNDGDMNGSEISVVDKSQAPLTLLWVVVNICDSMKCSFPVRGW